jgi:hypothetical protein
MMLRWVAAGILEAVKGFRRLKGYADMPALADFQQPAGHPARRLARGLGDSGLSANGLTCSNVS